MSHSNDVVVDVRRICDHQETQRIRYKGHQEYEYVMRTEKMFHCKACTAAVEEAFANPVESEQPFEYTELSGTPKQISWARNLRAKHASLLLRVVATLLAKQEPQFDAVCGAIRAFLDESDSRFWIESREIKFDARHFLWEASLFNMPSTKGITFSQFSTFGRMKRHAPSSVCRYKRFEREGFEVGSAALSAV